MSLDPVSLQVMIGGLRAACFSAIEGGDFKGFTPVKPEFYQPIIDARKAKIG